MRRSKQPEAATPPASQLTPESPPRVRTTGDPASDVPGLDDLERGRTAALIASLGRVQLTLDLIERRLGRLEQAVAGLEAGVTDVPAQTVLLLDVAAADDLEAGEADELNDSEEVGELNEATVEEFYAATDEEGLVILDELLDDEVAGEIDGSSVAGPGLDGSSVDGSSLDGAQPAQ